MSEVFFTADPHFDHKGIIAYSNRPFADVEGMNEVLSDNINNKVGRRDTLYILGDFAWGGHGRFIEAIKCRKILIRGSHDKMKMSCLNSFSEVWDTRIMTHGGRVLVPTERGRDPTTGVFCCTGIVMGGCHPGTCLSTWVWTPTGTSRTVGRSFLL